MVSSVFGLLVVIIVAIIVAGAVKNIESIPSNQLNFSGYDPTKERPNNFNNNIINKTIISYKYH